MQYPDHQCKFIFHAKLYNDRISDNRDQPKPYSENFLHRPDAKVIHLSNPCLMIGEPAADEHRTSKNS